MVMSMECIRFQYMNMEKFADCPDSVTNHIILNFTTHQADFRAIRHKLQTCHLLFSYVVFEVRSF